MFIIDKPGEPLENLKDTLKRFYGTAVLYDLCYQYILDEGKFRYEYRWLTERIKNESMAEGARETFEEVFGVNPGKAELL
ncbi:MAG: hypothetical protein U5L06_00985 [Rhodovibrio sp.]|nr:hypothetical protein [Rhodovibrio sp.]